MKISWTVTLKGREIDGGCLDAPSEREALDKLMSQTLPVKASECYRVKVGGLTASVYGDEFKSMVGASSLREDKKLRGKHLFSDPRCKHPSMNRDVYRNDCKHAACDDCEFVDPVPVVRTVKVKIDKNGDIFGHAVEDSDDADRLREKLTEAAQAAKKAGVALKDFADTQYCAHNNTDEQATHCFDCGQNIFVMGAGSRDRHLCAHPVIKRCLEDPGITVWRCADCGAHHAMANKMTERLRVAIHPINIRRAMSQ